MKQCKIELREVSKLIPCINKSSIHGENQIKQIAASINEFGFTNPLLIDSYNNVIAGHGRLLACKLLGIKEVPCVLVGKFNIDLDFNLDINIDEMIKRNISELV